MAIKIGWIGAGSTLNVMFGPTLKHLPEVQIAAVADPSAAARSNAVEKWGVPVAYDSVGAMLESEELDGVYIGSPPFCHLEHVAAASSHGLPILLEKPMARTVMEAHRMVDLCSEADVLLIMAFNRRLLPPLWTATQMLEAGQLGEVFSMECIWTSWTCGQGNSWRDSAACLGGGFQDHGSHSFDLASQWLGPIESVSAQAHCIGPRIGQEREVEDHVSALARHVSGLTSVHIHSRSCHRPVSELYRIYGSTGTLELEYTGGWGAVIEDNWGMRLYREGGAFPERLVSRRPGHELLGELSDASYAFYSELKGFALAVGGEADSIGPVGEDGLAAVQAIAASYLSALEDRMVPLSDAGRFDETTYKKLMARYGVEIQ